MKPISYSGDKASDNLYCLVNLPDKVLRRTNNPYGWTDHEYYEQYIEEVSEE